MIEAVIHFLEVYILPLGPLGVFLASIIEEVIAPIPSALVLFLSGFLFLKGLSGWALFESLIVNIAIPATLGITIGSLFVYMIGFYFGKPFFVRWGKYLGVSWEEIERARTVFSKGPRDELVLILVRAVPIIPSVVISGACGVIRLPMRTYLIATTIGLIPRILVLGYVGFLAGDAYGKYASVIQSYEKIVLVSVVLIVVTFFVYRMSQNKKVV